MRTLASLLAVAAIAAFGLAGPASAQTDFGTGPGCSPIEGVLATTLGNGDSFTGRIGTTAVSGFNKNGKAADNSDNDAFTDSVEECINDALIGYCTTVFGDEDSVISVVPGTLSGRNDNKQEFTVTFDDTSVCAVTQCSDHVDNDTDNEIDFGGFDGFPADTNCTDYNDNTEAS